MHEIPEDRTSAIVAMAAEACFGKPLVNNVLRAVIAEAIVASQLDRAWDWCSADWAECDFRHRDGTRLEVKQSAARQTWHKDGAPPSAATFDIAERVAAWVGDKYVESIGRNAEIYVFAHHPVTDESCDHRDPSQWRFYVVPTHRLPASKRISLAALRRLATAVAHDDLGAEVTRALGDIRPARTG